MVCSFILGVQLFGKSFGSSVLFRGPSFDHEMC